MKIPAPQTRKARIEIIPMIDTIFFLLVFFMYSSLSMIKMKGMTVAIPRSGSAPAVAGIKTPASPATFIVTVTDSGDYYVNDTRIGQDKLAQVLQSSISANPKGVVVVNVAKGQTAQTLITVMDAINKVTTPTGDHVTAMIATEPVDTHGRALAPAH